MPSLLVMSVQNDLRIKEELIMEILMSIGFYFFGMGIGVIIGMQYIPAQLKKKNPKIIKQVKDLLDRE